MSKIDKKIDSMKTSPQQDWKVGDLQFVAKRYGIEYRQPGTSHVTFSCSNGDCLTVPAHKPIKPVYIKKFIEMIENVKREEAYD